MLLAPCSNSNCFDVVSSGNFVAAEILLSNLGALPSNKVNLSLPFLNFLDFF